MNYLTGKLNRALSYKALVGFVLACILGPAQVSFARIDSTHDLHLEQRREFKTSFKGYFSPDGTRLALIGAVGYEGISVVSVPEGKKICQMSMDADADVMSLQFSPDGKSIAISYYTFVRQTRELIRRIALSDALTCNLQKTLVSKPASYIGDYISFSPDGLTIAGISNVPLIWKRENGDEIYRLDLPENYHPVNTLMSSDGKWLATYAEAFIAPHTSSSFRVVNLKTKQNEELNKSRLIDFSFSRDSSLLITTEKVFDRLEINYKVKAVLYEVGSWKIVKEFELGNDARSLSISPDNSLLAIGTTSGTFKIFSILSGKLVKEGWHYKRTLSDDIQRVPHFISCLLHVEFSPDGTMLVTGGQDATVKLWKLQFNSK